MECDDGNLLDGDGCSSKCTIEPNYICYGGDINHPDKCNSTLPLKFASTNYYGNKTLAIVFNKPVFLKATLDKIFSLKIEGKLGQTFSYTWTSNSINERTIFIDINLMCSLTGDEVITIQKFDRIYISK